MSRSNTVLLIGIGTITCLGVAAYLWFQRSGVIGHTQPESKKPIADIPEEKPMQDMTVIVPKSVNIAILPVVYMCVISSDGATEFYSDYINESEHLLEENPEDVERVMVLLGKTDDDRFILSVHISDLIVTFSCQIEDVTSDLVLGIVNRAFEQIEKLTTLSEEDRSYLYREIFHIFGY